MSKFFAFDIEVATWPENDWDGVAALGITCAVTQIENEDPVFWHAPEYGPQIERETLRRLVSRLLDVWDHGYDIVSWNGAGFDLRLLAIESGMHEECAELALHHCDMMYQFFCQRGFAVGLSAVARGMKLGDKTEGVTGADAPRMWAEGRHAEVLEYCARDVELTIAIAQYLEKQCELHWITKRGRRSSEPIARLLTVEEAGELPLPDNSWMNEPWPRSKFIDWVERK